YYAATVLSMLQSWHTFFFASFDPGGFVTVDKPPLGFWVQAASARLLGFSGLSLLLPEALAGVAAVAVLYALVRRAGGPVGAAGGADAGADARERGPQPQQHHRLAAGAGGAAGRLGGAASGGARQPALAAAGGAGGGAGLRDQDAAGLPGGAGVRAPVPGRGA